MLEVTKVECSCEVCKSMCERPCWGYPEDIEKLIEAGYGDRLMQDYWVGDTLTDGVDVEVLCPAVKGSEGRVAPFWPVGSCTLQDKDGMCMVHNMKPTEGSNATCKTTESNSALRDDIVKAWNTPKGMKICDDWYGRSKGKEINEETMRKLMKREEEQNNV